MTVLAYSPLLSGSFTRADRKLPQQYVSFANQKRLEALKTVAEELNATANQVVLAWMLAQNPPVIPVMGVSTESQLRENWGALNLSLLPEHINALERIS